MKKTRLPDWPPSDPRCVRIEVEPWRFGILFGPEPVPGDIGCGMLERLSHSKADSFPSADRHCILHQGLRYVGVSHGPGPMSDHEVGAYELAPLTAGVTPPKRVQFSYSGEQVRLFGQPHVLCRPIRFVSRPLTEPELRWRSRQRWAWGGYFALEWDTYEAFVQEDLRHCGAVTMRALSAELRSRAVHLSRFEMKVLTQRDPLFLARPWLAAKPRPSDKVKVAFALSADDCLAALLA